LENVSAGQSGKRKSESESEFEFERSVGRLERTDRAWVVQESVCVCVSKSESEFERSVGMLERTGGAWVEESVCVRACVSKSGSEGPVRICCWTGWTEHCWCKNVYVYMYVCMYVCVCVCMCECVSMYACMYPVRMYACMYARTNVRICSYIHYVRICSYIHYRKASLSFPMYQYRYSPHFSLWEKTILPLFVVPTCVRVAQVPRTHSSDGKKNINILDLSLSFCLMT
jgi:hypothetical protein